MKPILIGLFVFLASAGVSCTSHDGYITGDVQEIQNGKDGYTAKIITSEKEIYFATISRVNLAENSAQYRPVKIGERISVKGDLRVQAGENHLTVRSLK